MTNLRDLRMLHGNMTQKQLASFLHVDRSAISKWETGKQAPDYDMINRIANFFEMPLVSVVEMFIKNGGKKCPQR